MKKLNLSVLLFISFVLCMNVALGACVWDEGAPITLNCGETGITTDLGNLVSGCGFGDCTAFQLEGFETGEITNSLSGDTLTTNTSGINYDGTGYVKVSAEPNGGGAKCYGTINVTGTKCVTTYEADAVTTSVSNTVSGTWIPNNYVANSVAICQSGAGGYIEEVYADPYAQPNTKILLHMDDASFSDASNWRYDVSSTGVVKNNSVAKFGSSAYFDGSSKLSIADSDDWNFGTGDFTIEFWINYNINSAQYQMPIAQWQDGGGDNRAWEIDFIDNGGGAYVFNFDTLSGSATTSWTPLNNTWMHIAVVRDGNNMYLFQNGTIIDTTDVTGWTTTDSASPLTIGAGNQGSSYFVEGFIDEVRIIKGTAKWTANFTPETEAYQLNRSTKLSYDITYAGGDDTVDVPNDCLYANVTHNKNRVYFEGGVTYRTDCWNGTAWNEVFSIGSNPYGLELIYSYPVTEAPNNSSWVYTNANRFSGDADAWDTGGQIGINTSEASFTFTSNYDSNWTCSPNDWNYTTMLAWNESSKLATTDTTSHAVTSYPFNITEGDQCIYCAGITDTFETATSTSGCLNLSYTPIDEPPNVTLNSPADGFNGLDSDDVTFNCSATDDNGLLNISLYLTSRDNTSFTLNETTNITGLSNGTTWTKSLVYGNYTWNCLATADNNVSSFGTNRSFTLNNTAPSNVAIILPTNATTYLGDGTSYNVTFNFRATDAEALTYYLFINGTLNTTTSVNTSSVVFATGTYYANLTVSDGTSNTTNSTPIYFTIGSANLSISACLSSFTVTPTAANSQGIAPLNQNVTNCSYNITNNDNATTRFYLKYTGSTTVYPYTYLNTFNSNYGTYSIEDPNSVNSTYNWTRLCLGVTDYELSTSQGLGSMRVIYNFNNTKDTTREYYNGSSWIVVNTTFDCINPNYINFNLTKTNYTAYRDVSISYKLLSGDNVSFWLNITSDNSSFTTSPIEINSTTNWTKFTSVNIWESLNMANITSYKIVMNGTGNGNALFDALYLNNTNGESKIDFLAGNDTNNTATTLTSSYQNVFNISAGETMPLKFWFNFNFPLMGTSLDLSLLDYKGES